MKKEYLMAGFAIFCWSTMAPVSKLLLSDLTNMEVLGYGSAIASITLLIILLISGEWRRFRQYRIPDLLQLSLIGTVGYFLYSAFYYQGLSVLPAQTACILNYLWPIFTVCLSALLLKEPFSPSRLAALLLSFLGVIVILFQPGTMQQSVPESLAGSFCCVTAAALYAVFNILNKKRGMSQTINMFLYISVSAVLALLCCSSDGFTVPTAAQLPGLLWLGIFIDAAGFLFWAMALQKSNTASIANFAYLTPAVSLLLSALFLHEPVYFTSVIGLALILGGLFLQMKMPAHRLASR